MVSNIKPPPVEDAGEEEEPYTKTSASGVTAPENRSETKSVDGCVKAISLVHQQDLTARSIMFNLTPSLEDVGPALAYREANKIN